MKALCKKGQAAGAAVLLVIIAAMLIGFIVLVSPEERATILGEDGDRTSNASRSLTTTASVTNLLTVSPGRVDYLAQREIEHPLPTVNIFTRTEARVLEERNLAYAKRGVFSEESGLIEFVIPDLEHTENVLLSFKVMDAKGKLITTLNDQELFKGEVAPGVFQPLNIPQSLLQEKNALVFSVSSPGLAFWSTHEVFLEDIRIVGDVTSVEAQHAKNIFLISETEQKNLEKMTLKFQPDCAMGKVGKLTITINGNEIYRGLPDCDVAMVPIEFSPRLINEGENEIVFFTERGTYLLSHLVLESNLKEVDFPTYYFEVTDERYEDVYDEDLRVRVTLNFVDVVSRKYGDLVFNGHVSHFDTKEASYTADLSLDLVRGTNSLKIKPRKTIEVRELKIDLVK